jgi:hypothetical protein
MVDRKGEIDGSFRSGILLNFDGDYCLSSCSYSLEAVRDMKEYEAHIVDAIGASPYPSTPIAAIAVVHNRRNSKNRKRV